MKYWFGFGCGVVSTIVALLMFVLYAVNQGVMEDHSASDDEAYAPPSGLQNQREFRGRKFRSAPRVDSLPQGWRIT